MTLTQTQLDNTSAASFDVRLRFFADGMDFDVRTDLTGYTADAAPAGWTISGDAITPGGAWTEITARVAGDVTYTYEWSEGQMTWQAALRGWEYDAALLGAGKSVLCLRRMTRPATALSAAYDTGWVLWWLGVIQDGGWKDDYKKGGPWQRTVKSVDATLALTDAPRLTVGRLRVEEGAGVTASSTLATPAAEAGNGEFVGSLANVEPGNVVDGRTASVWISQDPPVTEAEPTAYWPGPLVDEVFNEPVAGYSRARSWWVEIVNPYVYPLEFGAKSGKPSSYGLYARNAAGQNVVMQFVTDKTTSMILQPGDRLVVCGHQQTFEAITGGANVARFVVEAISKPVFVAAADGAPTTTEAEFDLHPTDGFVVVGTPWDAIGWGTYWSGVKWGTVTMPWATWVGAGVSLAGIQPGQSIRRKPSGTNTTSAADWAIEPYPHPGAKWAPALPQWLRVELREHVSTLGADAAAGATTLTIDEGTTGWPAAGDGVIEGDTFSWTGRAAGSLTGVTGLASGHVQGAVVYPTRSDGEAMTGWRSLDALVKRLPGRSKIKRLRAYTSPFGDCRTPDDELWTADYDATVIVIENGTDADNALSDIRLPIVKPKDDSIWLRTLLVVIDEMWDGGRAKMNETLIEVDQLTVNASGLADIDNARCVDVARYLVANYTWLADGTLVQDGAPAAWGQVGDLATGIAKLPAVIADLARGTGCIAAWTRAGKLRIVANPWWPGGAGSDGKPEATLAEAYIRGEIGVQDGPPTATGVAVSAQDGAGNALARYVVPPGASGSGVVEISGVTVASEGAVGPLAWNLYWQTVNTERLTGLVLKGLGEWASPRLRVALMWDGEALGQWIIERVTQTWRASEAGRDWRTVLDLRKFFVG